MFTLLVAEDDLHLRKLMSAFLHLNGFQVLQASNGEEALAVMDKNQVDLVIADIMMPVMDGFTLTAQIRQSWPLLPILMVTARDGLEDKRIGFSAGTDDYMVKPVDLDELVIRVQALLRRARILQSKRLTVGNLTLDGDAMTATIDGENLPVTVREFNILFKLLSYPSKSFSRTSLMDDFWGADSDTSLRAVDTYIARLRDKFSACTGFKLVTVHGLGYKAVLQ